MFFIKNKINKKLIIIIHPCSKFSSKQILSRSVILVFSSWSTSNSCFKNLKIKNIKNIKNIFKIKEINKFYHRKN